jgi:hypothetical protein
VNLPGWLWPIAYCSAAGGFIDFLIGRVGQKRARGFLETWWIKFDDVRWNNFGRKEALFAVHLLDFWCGRRFFSLRRWVSIYVFFPISIIFGHVVAMFQSTRGFNLPLIITPPAFVTAPLSAIGLAVSLSLTRLIAVIVAGLCTDGKLRNFTLFTMFLIFTYFLLALWLPVIHFFKFLLPTQIIASIYVTYSLSAAIASSESFMSVTVMKTGFYLVSPQSIALEFLDALNLHSILPTFRERLFDFYAMNFAQILAGYVAYLVRLIMALAFVGSFIVRPILMKPISLIWRRIVESDKPLFTLTLGGVAALVELVGGLLKHL